jgi:carbon-monoxide dehydrogenase medium subunit
MITRVTLPLLPDETRVGFYEFARRAGDFAQVMALVTYAVAGGVIAAPVVAIGSLGSRAWRNAVAEAALLGAAPGAPAFAAAAKAAAAAIALAEEDPYLRALCETAVLRALTAAH